MESTNPFKENIINKYLPEMLDLSHLLPVPQTADINKKTKEFALTYKEQQQGTIADSPWTGFFKIVKKKDTVTGKKTKYMYRSKSKPEVNTGESLFQIKVVLKVGKLVKGKIIPENKEITFNKNHIQGELTYTQWEGKVSKEVILVSKEVKGNEKPTRLISGSFQGLKMISSNPKKTYEATGYFGITSPKENATHGELMEIAVEWAPENNKK